MPNGQQATFDPLEYRKYLDSLSEIESTTERTEFVPIDFQSTEETEFDPLEYKSFLESSKAPVFEGLEIFTPVKAKPTPTISAIPEVEEEEEIEEVKLSEVVNQVKLRRRLLNDDPNFAKEMKGYAFEWMTQPFAEFIAPDPSKSISENAIRDVATIAYFTLGTPFMAAENPKRFAELSLSFVDHVLSSYLGLVDPDKRQEALDNWKTNPVALAIPIIAAKKLRKRPEDLTLADIEIVKKKYAESFNEVIRSNPGLVNQLLARTKKVPAPTETYTGVIAKEIKRLEEAVSSAKEKLKTETLPLIRERLETTIVQAEFLINETKQRAVKEGKVPKQKRELETLVEESEVGAIPSKDIHAEYLKAKNIREPVSENIVEEVDIVYDKSRQEFSDLNKKSIKTLRDALVTGLIDVSGNVKARLLAIGGKEAQAAVIEKNLLAGSSARTQMLHGEAVKYIYEGLSKNERIVLDNMLRALADIDISARKPNVKHMGEKTAGELYRYVEEKLQTLPKDSKKRILQAKERYFETTNRELKKLFDAGLIPEEVYNHLNQYIYEPRYVIDYIDPIIRTQTLAGKKVTVRESGIKALEEGTSASMLMNSEKLLADLIARTDRRIALNKTNINLYELAKANPENGLVRILETGEKVKANEGVIELFVEGEKQRMAMPADMAAEWIISDPLQKRALHEVVGWMTGTKVLKSMATGINPEFAISNMPRDMAYIYLTTTEFSPIPEIFVPQFARELATTFSDAITRKGRYRDYIMEGGGMEFLTLQGRLGGKKKLPRVLNDLQNALGYIGETAEVWSRLALRERAIRNGKNPVEATAIARGYLDFSQGGRYIKALDSGIPYLNASIQGTRGILRAAKENKAQFTFKLAQLSRLTAELYFANKFINPEAYDQISDMDKRNYWIITTPYYKVDDEGNKRYYYARISKDQGQRSLTYMTESLLEREFEGKQPDINVLEEMRELLNLVPEGNIPPVIKAYMGAELNKDFWTKDDLWGGTDVLPQDEFYKNYTPEIYKDPLMRKFINAVSAGATKGSPVRTQYFIEQFTTRGNIYTDIVGGLYKQMVKDLPEEQKKELNDDIIKKPFLRRSFKLTNPNAPKEREKIKEEQRITNSLRLRNNRQLNDFITKYDNKEADKNELKIVLKDKDSGERRRLVERFQTSRRLKKVSGKNKSFLLDLLYEAKDPKTRARIFFNKYSGLNDKERRLLKADIINVPGLFSGTFAKEFIILEKQSQ